jgi:hypothetical protein
MKMKTNDIYKRHFHAKTMKEMQILERAKGGSPKLGFTLAI